MAENPDPQATHSSSSKSSSLFVPLFLAALILLVIGFVFAKSKLSITSRPTSEESPSPVSEVSTNPPPQNQEFTNTKHGYKLRYSSDFEMTSSLEAEDLINFKSVSDNIPARSGISIQVISSPVGLRETCPQGNLEIQGILCPQGEISYTSIGSPIVWEVYPKELVGYVPTGYIHSSVHKNGNIYLVINHGYEESVANTFVSNFTFLE